MRPRDASKSLSVCGSGISAKKLEKSRLLQELYSFSSPIRRTLSIVLVILIWECAARWIANPLFFVSIGDILRRAAELARSGELQVHTWTSLIELSVGLGAAIVVGIIIAVVMASSRVLEDFCDPWVSMFYSMPIVALGPLVILWFGIGLTSKIVIIFLLSVFPVIINTYVGLVETDRNLVDAARSFGATTLQTFMKVRFPAAMPFILSGVRHAIARALIGVVVAELFGAQSGLGYLILYSGQTFDTAGLFVGVFILSVCGILSVEILNVLERVLVPWRARRRGE